MAFLVSHVSHRERVAAGLEKTNTLRILNLRCPLLTYLHPNLQTIIPSFLLVMLFLQDGVADAKERTDEGMLKEEKSTCQKRYDADSKVLSTTG